MQDAIKRIFDYSLEEIMGVRFGEYAKSIIQERALPDVRDGLKPVQRRILYGMYRDKNTFDKAYKKSAKTVGNVMGQYHPHGDSSIYEAMVRMSQWWKQNAITIDMHGNNGSMDGDSAAAMRYTEARLSKISNELLKDIDKDTILWTWNYDDTLLEPTVLPAKFPNLLVNGSTGISAGYATNIPPHNLKEIIDATIYLMDNPDASLDDIMNIIKGPDFPTGGIVEGINGIRESFKSGRGKIIVKSKYEIGQNKGKKQIIITEIPFEVNKAALVKKIDDIRIDKKIDGIVEVRDESNLDNPETIVIDLKKDANCDLILNYLLKNTEMQISYNYNMVSIVNNRPMTLGIIDILKAYIEHQKEVVTKKTKFDLEHAKARMHIVEGLIKALSILDEIIAIIRSSKNKSDSINNLVLKFDFTEKQATAIVDLQLYRLSNTDVTDLLEEQKNLQKIIRSLESILASSKKLADVIKKELVRIKDEYGVDRKTVIKEEITDIKIDTTELLPKEDCIVVVTHDGYVKRTSLRSFNSSEEGVVTVKDRDYVVCQASMNTLDTILIFTDLGNYLFVPVHELPDLKWKELGKHISNIIKLNEDENIVEAFPIYDFDAKQYITIFTKNGMVKRTNLIDFKVQRYSKPITCMKLKDDDRVVSVSLCNSGDILVTTFQGYGLRYKLDEVPIVGLKTSGVKAINLKDDYVVNGCVFSSDSDEYLVLVTNKNTAKRIHLSEFEYISRAKRGIQIIRDVKTNPYNILKTFIVDNKDTLGIKTKDDIFSVKSTEIPILDRYSTGTNICKNSIIDVFKENKLITKNVNEEEKTFINTKPVLDNIDSKIMTIDDFLDDFKI